MEDLKINSLMRTIGTLQASIGLKTITKASSEFEVVRIDTDLIRQGFKRLGIEGAELDVAYYSTSAENWEKILETIWGIVKNFPWREDRSDCDDRAIFVVALCSIIFGLNTCSWTYCDRNNLDGDWSGRHYSNIVIDKTGNIILFGG